MGNWDCETQTDPMLQALCRKVKEQHPERMDADIVSECIRRGIRDWQHELLASRESSKSIREVFDFWASVFRKKRAVCSEHRASKVRARLREGYSVQDLKNAIVGASRSEYHVQNGYTDLATILRTPMTVDRHLALFRGEIRSTHAMGSESFSEKPLSSIFEGEKRG